MSVGVSSLVWANGPTKAADRLMLLALADNADDYGLAWPGMARLAEKCCVGVDAARASVRRLEADGWVTVITGGGTRDGIHGLPNRYQIDLDRLRKPTPLSTGGSPSAPAEPTPPWTPTYPPVDAVPTPPWTGGEPSVEPSVEPSLELLPAVVGVVDDGIGTEFDAFWALYPRKVGKRAAERAYRAARKRAPMEAIAAALRDQMPFLRSRQVGFIPHPSTWLNRDPWADVTADTSTDTGPVNWDLRHALNGSPSGPVLDGPTSMALRMLGEAR